jgi:hypothetical protein
MERIFFSKNIKALSMSTKGKMICIFHKQYEKCLPQMDDCQFVEFGCLCDTFQEHDYFTGMQSVVFVGANKFFTTSTRFHPVFEILQYGLKGLERFAVDKSPYIGPLWRIFPQFSLASVPFGEYTYSYLLESHYNSYLAGVRADNPLDIETIRGIAAGNVSIDYERFFSAPKIVVVEMSSDVHDGYQALKEELFYEHSDINKIIRELADFAKASCKERRVPSEHKIFDMPDDISIVRTDLKVDEYLVGKLVDKISEVNRIVGALQ